MNNEKHLEKNNGQVWFSVHKKIVNIGSGNKYSKTDDFSLPELEMTSWYVNALQSLCDGNLPFNSGFPSQRVSNAYP